MLYQQQTINAKGILLDLTKPVVMGVLNVTPDSFFDGGKYKGIDDAVDQASKMLAAGAQIIDIGGMSSRPGAKIIAPEEELRRIGEVLKELATQFPEAILSIDTLHGKTAAAALETGAHIVNDISGGRHDPDIVEVAAQNAAPFVCMHMQGTPADMQRAPGYGDVVHDILVFFVERLELLRQKGIKDIILDPGFGFGKTVRHNYEILHKLGVFQILEQPVLAGLSRKSMICRVLDVPPQEALNGTSGLNFVALQHGARILRVHDVKEAMEVIKLFEAYDAVSSPEESGMADCAYPR